MQCVCAVCVSSDDSAIAQQTQYTLQIDSLFLILPHCAVDLLLSIYLRHTWRCNVHNHYYSRPVLRKNLQCTEKSRISVMFQFRTINCSMECAHTVKTKSNKMLLMIQRDLPIRIGYGFHSMEWRMYLSDFFL